MMKNKQNKKERFQTIEINFDEYIYNPECDDLKEMGEEAKIFISNKGVFIEDIETGERVDMSAYTSLFYEKNNKKKKIINKMIWNGENDINLNIFKKYDGIFAIDTSPCLISDKEIRVTGIVQLYKENEERYIGIIKNKIWVNSEIKGEEREVFAYAKTLDYIACNNHEKKRNIIFIDCNLDNLEDYNSRKKALIRDFYVPRNCELAYASSDAESDYIGNLILKEADKSAKECAKKIKIEGVKQEILNEEKSFSIKINYN